MTIDTKLKRAHLRDYTDAARHIELQGMVVSVLEGLQSYGARRAIAALLKDQQVQLKRLDKAAARLGVPYPEKVQCES